MVYIIKLIVLAFTVTLCWGRIHNLYISNDARKYIAISTFGFYKGGLLTVDFNNFLVKPLNKNDMFGFSLDRTRNEAMTTYLDAHQDRCLLQQKFPTEHAAIYFTLDLNNKVMQVNCSPEWQQAVHIYKSLEDMPLTNSRRDMLGDTSLLQRITRGASVPPDPCSKMKLEVVAFTKKNLTYYNTSFLLYVASDSEEGPYNLYFHSCPNYIPEREVTYDFSMAIVEENAGGSYLSAGEMPLPALYCTMSVLFFLSGCFWVFLLRQSRHPVFKIHYLMAALVFLKAITLAFHGVNYHFIEIHGVHLATWAIMFYIAHLLKGALLFITLVLIGTGWTFIKHVLAPRDKRLFMAVIPLQVLANVASIILEESEEGAREHKAWQHVFTVVDVLCCGCILFPVVWSIRHLREASETDGKAVTNLRKLKLFRHFYVMILCYIYFTRIIVYLLSLTVPFQYGWLYEMFREMATYVFFVLTGYKFRPAAHNPYFMLPSDDEDEDEDEVLTESGITEGLTRVNSRLKHPKLTEMTEISEEEQDSLLIKKESSHEYD